LLDTIKSHKELIAQREDIQGILRDPHIVSGKLDAASSYFSAFWHTPNATQEMVLNHLKQSLREPLSQVNGFFEGQWNDYRQAVERAKVSFFEEYEKIGME
jgi:hypothetical protein